MKVVVDTNIVFSAMLNPFSPIGKIIIFGQKHYHLHFFAPYLLKEEIKRHKSKIIESSQYINDALFEDIRDEVFRCVNFISEEQIPYNFWHEAIPFVRDIDMDDIAFVTLAEYLDARLWTGDKRLLTGLEQRGFKRIITTEEILNTTFQNQ